MFKVYSEFKALAFVRTAPADARFVFRPQSGDDLAPANLLQKVEKGNTLWIVTPEPSVSFAEFGSRFRIVEAAGGVVSGPQGRVMMIYRNGVWDLPKGHVEPGETPECAAVREVGEECGIAVGSAGELITRTYHFYMLDGQWVMKRCAWYGMKYAGSAPPVPQREEGIRKAEWLGGAKLLKAAAGSYATIRDVLKIYLDNESK